MLTFARPNSPPRVSARKKDRAQLTSAPKWCQTDDRNISRVAVTFSQFAFNITHLPDMCPTQSHILCRPPTVVTEEIGDNFNGSQRFRQSPSRNVFLAISAAVKRNKEKTFALTKTLLRQRCFRWKTCPEAPTIATTREDHARRTRFSIFSSPCIFSLSPSNLPPPLPRFPLRTE